MSLKANLFPGLKSGSVCKKNSLLHCLVPSTDVVGGSGLLQLQFHGT